MLNNFSNWRMAAFDEDLSTDNALLSEEQESAKHNIFSILERAQNAVAEPLDIEALAAIIQSVTEKGDEEAAALAQEYMRNPIHNEIDLAENEPEIENQVSQEQMMAPSMNTTLDSTVPSSAPPPGSSFSSRNPKNSSDYAKQQWPGKNVSQAIEEEITHGVNTGATEEELVRYALMTAEEFFDAPINSLEDLETILPGSAEKIKNYIQAVQRSRGAQEQRELAENDPDEFVDRFAKYPGHHKPGDKKHLKGEGPVNEKANEIYHAIMREKDIKGEPSEEDKSSAAAISWSQAQKNKGKKEKKTYFRGQEAEVLDTYRDMWGQNISRIRVAGSVIEVPVVSLDHLRESSDLNEIEELINFVESAPKETDNAAQIMARIQNLKTATSSARAMLLKEELSFNEQKALNSIYRRCAAELEMLDDQDNFVTIGDVDRVQELPQFEIGADIYTSSFSQHSSDWLDIAAEEASSPTINDIDKFVREDPILLVSELPETIMGDAGAVRTHAKKRVASATAYINDDIKSQVVSKYLENAENARRSALQMSKMKSAKQVQKRTASVKSVPDEGLFL